MERVVTAISIQTVQTIRPERQTMNSVMVVASVQMVSLAITILACVQDSVHRSSRQSVWRTVKRSTVATDL